jgi:inorganic pyrophosphatase
MEKSSRAEALFSTLDKWLSEGGVTLDRPKGTPSERNPSLRYLLDYGYIPGTRAQDGESVDVFQGDRLDLGIVGIICSVDEEKKDAEIKVLYGCTDENIQTAMMMMNGGAMHGVLIRRKTETEERT